MMLSGKQTLFTLTQTRKVTLILHRYFLSQLFQHSVGQLANPFLNLFLEWCIVPERSNDVIW